MGSGSVVNRVQLVGPDLTCHRVTVYSDRAEVKRRFSTKIKAIICEVKYTNRVVKEVEGEGSSESRTRRREIEAKLRDLKKKKAKVEKDVDRTKSRRDIILGVAQQVTKGTPILGSSDQVKDTVISTSFEVARPTTIPSDNTAHKVNVVLVELKPKMEYWSVPSKSAAAYLKARVENRSPYALLAGPASIFLDNSFVAKETGMLSWLAADVETRQQKIKLKNTRQEAVKLTLLHQLPLSEDEKIKVSLLAPSVTKEGKEKVSLNKDNNLEWILNLAAGESKEIEIRYSIEVPRKEALTFYEC